MLPRLDEIVQISDGWEVTLTHFPHSSFFTFYIDDEEYLGDISLNRLSPLGEKDLEKTVFRRRHKELISKSRVQVDPDWLSHSLREKLSVSLFIHDLTLPSSVLVFDLPTNFSGGFRLSAKRIDTIQEFYYD
jgi:hypothetical protein